MKDKTFGDLMEMMKIMRLIWMQMDGNENDDDDDDEEDDDDDEST